MNKSKLKKTKKSYFDIYIRVSCGARAFDVLYVFRISSYSAHFDYVCVYSRSDCRVRFESGGFGGNGPDFRTCEYV